MDPIKEQFEAIRQLIRDKKYDQARQWLRSIEHPMAAEWLAKLDRIAPESMDSIQPIAPLPYSGPMRAARKGISVKWIGIFTGIIMVIVAAAVVTIGMITAGRVLLSQIPLDETYVKDGMIIRYPKGWIGSDTGVAMSSITITSPEKGSPLHTVVVSAAQNVPDDQTYAAMVEKAKGDQSAVLVLQPQIES